MWEGHWPLSVREPACEVEQWERKKKTKHWGILASGVGFGIIPRTARGWVEAKSWACQTGVQWLIGTGNTAKSRETTLDLHPFVHALGSEMEQLESFIKEQSVECNHWGSSARNSQVFSYCALPSLRTSECASVKDWLDVSRGGVGVQPGCAWDLSSTSPPPSPSPVFFIGYRGFCWNFRSHVHFTGIWVTGKSVGLFSKRHQANPEGLWVFAEVSH